MCRGNTNAIGSIATFLLWHRELVILILIYRTISALMILGFPVKPAVYFEYISRICKLGSKELCGTFCTALEFWGQDA